MQSVESLPEAGVVNVFLEVGRGHSGNGLGQACVPAEVRTGRADDGAFVKPLPLLQPDLEVLALPLAGQGDVPDDDVKQPVRALVGVAAGPETLPLLQGAGNNRQEKSFIIQIIFRRIKESTTVLNFIDSQKFLTAVPARLLIPLASLQEALGSLAVIFQGVIGLPAW